MNNPLQIAESWCEENNAPKVDLCCGKNKKEGYIGVDLIKNEGVDLVKDLNQEWPFENDSVGLFCANNAVEYLENPLHVMREAYRCLKPEGWFLISVPSTDGRGAFENPLYKSYWNINSFRYYTDPSHISYINASVNFNLKQLQDLVANEFNEKSRIIHTIAALTKQA